MPTDDGSNRVRDIVDGLTGLENPLDMWEEISSSLPASNKIEVQSRKIYTFKYRAKTSGLLYDIHPLVGVEAVYNWGFVGVNFHWGERRSYTWDEVIGDVYEIQQEELTDMQRIPYADLLENPSK